MRGRQIPYTAEERDYIRSISQWPRDEAHASFCQKFRRDDVSLKNFNALCKRNGWLTGRTGRFAKGIEPHNKGKSHPARGRSAATQFKKGQTPHNTNYLGHERIDPKDGYIYISVDQPNPYTGYERRYVLKHKWLWEKVNGPVPHGMALKCLDSNKTNTDPSNWEPVKRAVLARLNGGRFKKTLAYVDAHPEIKPLVMAAANLKQRLAETRKGTS